MDRLLNLAHAMRAWWLNYQIALAEDCAARIARDLETLRRARADLRTAASLRRVLHPR